MQSEFNQTTDAEEFPPDVYDELADRWSEDCKNVMSIRKAESLRPYFEINLDRWLNGCLDDEIMLKVWNQFEDDLMQIQIIGRHGSDAEIVARADAVFESLREGEIRSNAWINTSNTLVDSRSLRGGDDVSTVRKYVFSEYIRDPDCNRNHYLIDFIPF